MIAYYIGLFLFVVMYFEQDQSLALGGITLCFFMIVRKVWPQKRKSL